ncbi:MAG: sirohydrochlorin cobaltochelatase [Clostridium sp.]
MKKAIVLVSFGTSSIEGMKKSIGGLTNELNKKLGDEYVIFNSFTSDRIRNILRETNGIVIQSLDEVLNELSLIGYEEVFIKPLHIFDGNEIRNIKKIIENYRDRFRTIHIGSSLLGYTGEKLENICNYISPILLKGLRGPILFIGHGSRTANHDEYYNLIEVLKQTYNGEIFFGTLEGKESIDQIIEKLKWSKVKHITIVPLLIMAGRHLRKDIILGSNSWNNLLKEANIEVSCVNKSLLEYKEIREIIYEEIKELHFTM